MCKSCLFCWFILILIQLPQNTGADERERKRLTLGIFWISATHRESRFYLFIILLEIHFQQHKGFCRYSKRVCLANAAWFIILFDVKRFCSMNKPFEMGNCIFILSLYNWSINSNIRYLIFTFSCVKSQFPVPVFLTSALKFKFSSEP